MERVRPMPLAGMDPGLPWQYTALYLCTLVNEPRVYWRAGFHPGQRCLKQHPWWR